MGQVLVEKTFGICMMLWIFEVVAHAWPLPVQLSWSPLNWLLVESLAVKSIGVAIVLAALAIYVRALVTLVKRGTMRKIWS